MQPYSIIAMTSHSKEQEAAVRLLEQQCRQAASFHVSSDIEHLVKEDGGHALLCYRGEQLIGLLSWFASGGDYAQINAMVHPDYRRGGIFRSLLQRAREDIAPLGVQKLSYRIPHGSQEGLRAAQSLGAVFDRSEYAMSYAHTEAATREYFLQTDEPERITYMAWTEGLPIGLIRVNYVNEDTAFIHNFCILPSCQGKGYGGIVLRQPVKRS